MLDNNILERVTHFKYLESEVSLEVERGLKDRFQWKDTLKPEAGPETRIKLYRMIGSETCVISRNSQNKLQSIQMILRTLGSALKCDRNDRQRNTYIYKRRSCRMGQFCYFQL